MMERAPIDSATVIVPCEPTWTQVLAGASALDAWSDDAIREDVDGSEMARRVYRAMTSASVSP
jgi:hypothetical protein